MTIKISLEVAKKKGLKRYFTGIPCKNGHISERFVYGSASGCLQCKRKKGSRYSSSEKGKASNKRYIESKKSRLTKKAYRSTEKYKEMKRKSDKKYGQSEKGKAAERRYNQSKKGRATIRAYKRSEKYKSQQRKYWKVWRKENRKRSSAYTMKYINSSVQARLASNLRTRMRLALKRQAGKKAKKTLELIGCDINYLRKHLEKQFKLEMTWGNYGKWHVDHIIAVNKFDLTDPEQQKFCFNYKNLQPMWAEENIRKSNK